MSDESIYQDRWKQIGIPENLIVRGDLDLTMFPIDELPNNLIVIGSLVIKDAPIHTLPTRLKVGGNIDLTGSHLEQLPDCLQLGGSLNISGSALLNLPPSIRVGRDLILGNTSIDVPADMYLGGRVIHSNSNKVDAFFNSAGYKAAGAVESELLVKSFKGFEL